MWVGGEKGVGGAVMGLWGFPHFPAQPWFICCPPPDNLPSNPTNHPPPSSQPAPLPLPPSPYQVPVVLELASDLLDRRCPIFRDDT